MQYIDMVICNSGDGSNHIKWVTDAAVIEAMEARADDGDETYASGDGLQVTTLKFPADFDLHEWMKTNNIRLTTLQNFE